MTGSTGDRASRATGSRDGSQVVVDLLDQLNTVGPSRLMETVLAALARETAVTAVRLLVIDLEEAHLEPRATLYAGAAMDRGEPIPLEGTPYGEAYRSGDVQVLDGGEPTVIAPVSARKEREGVLEARLARPATHEEAALIGSVATLVGCLVSAADRWTDEFHITRRTRKMSLAAEIQWSLLPLPAFASSDVSLAGALEPAYDVGGDAFDYAHGVGELFGGVFDAMGHGLRASRLSGLAVAAYRNARRAGADLDAQATALHEAVLGSFAREGYVTGILLRIDLGSPERSRIVRAGHPPPLLHRGAASPEPLKVSGGFPFGVPFENDLRSQPLELASGDRLVLYSDGVVEARPDEGEAFGLRMLGPALQRVRQAPAREAARLIIRSVRAHRAQELVDDATVLVIDIP